MTGRSGRVWRKSLDEIEPGIVLGIEGEFEGVRGFRRDTGFGLFGDVRGTIVEDELDRGAGRIGGVEKFEEFEEFSAAMAILDQSMDLTRRGDTK
jgi:hypothetical protein